ncbi:MAG: hypothetical protein NVSMB56_14340 [Pyrinomonadaceae bacterium]
MQTAFAVTPNNDQRRAPEHRINGEIEGESTEKSLVTDAAPFVSLCVASGDVVVRGWDKKEVRARSKDEVGIEFRTNAMVNRVEVNFSSNKNDSKRGDINGCRASADVQLDVPRGATVQLKTRAGNIEVTGVADARVETLSGDVSLERVGRASEASSLSGDVRLRDSRGRVRLNSVSGGIEVVNVQTVESSDDFAAKTVSGDVRLENIAHARVEATTVSGEVRLSGYLARGGRYDFKTTSGDVTVILPSDVACQVNAKVFQSGDIISDFPLKMLNPASTNFTRQINGIIGAATADAATLNLSSFSGTVHLRKLTD